MSTASFEFKQGYRFDQQVIMPERITTMLGAPGTILERQHFQRQHFRHGGLHSCPGCTGYELSRMGYKEESANLLVKADRVKLAEDGHSDKLEMVTKALWSAGLFSDGRFSPEISTTFRVCAKPSKVCPEGRISGYSHKKGYGRNCEFYTEEHDEIISKICNKYQSQWEEHYSESRYTLRIHKERRIAATVGRKPDLLFETIESDTGQVIRSHAIEIQKSPITMIEFEDRFNDLSKACHDQAWIFKASRAQGAFYDVLRFCVEKDIAAWLYEVKGQAGSNDNNICLYYAKNHYPGFDNWPPKAHKRYGKGSDSCTNAEWKEENDLGLIKKQPRVSSGSKVKYEEEGLSLLFPPEQLATVNLNAQPDEWAELIGRIIWIKHLPEKPNKQKMVLVRIMTNLFDKLLAKYPTIKQQQHSIVLVKAWRHNADYIQNYCRVGDTISVDGWVEIDTYPKRKKNDFDTLCLKTVNDGIQLIHRQMDLLIQ